MIVFIIVLILLIVLLWLPVYLDFKYIDGSLDCKIKYAMFTLYSVTEPNKYGLNRLKNIKKKKTSKSKPKSKTKNKSNQSNNKPSTNSSDVKSKPKSSTSKTTSKPKADSKVTSKTEVKTKSKSKVSTDSMDFEDLISNLDMVLDILKIIVSKLGVFIKSLKVKDLYIDFLVADEDACECALKFGKINAILYPTLSILNQYVKIKKKKISIQPKYNSNVGVYDVSFKVQLGLGSGIVQVVAIILKVIPVLQDNDIL